MIVEENLTPEPESTHAVRSLSPEKQAEIEDLARAIREAVDAEISELAANLATTDDAHLFGDNEFKIRALAHKIAAKAIEQHLAEKKTDTKASSVTCPHCGQAAEFHSHRTPHLPEPRGARPLPPRLLPLPALRPGAVPLRSRRRA